MKHQTDFERPIDWLAARGLTCRETEDPDVYIELPSARMKQLAKYYSRDSGIGYNNCLNIIAKAFGYKHYSHYVDLMKLKGEYKNSAEVLQKKRAKNSARRQAKNYCSQIETNPGLRTGVE